MIREHKMRRIILAAKYSGKKSEIESSDIVMGAIVLLIRSETKSEIKTCRIQRGAGHMSTISA